ncbi:MAG TPA: hypothetical protein VFG99_06015 [Chloroflexia bacterium]|nr:hypothetical protein [Chloroflexia bacterium]
MGHQLRKLNRTGAQLRLARKAERKATLALLAEKLPVAMLESPLRAIYEGKLGEAYDFLAKEHPEWTPDVLGATALEAVGDFYGKGLRE